MKNILISSLIFLLVGAACYQYIQQGGLADMLGTLKLLPQAEPLTELYLNNSSELPTTVNAGQVVPFSFTIHNLEGKPENYSYEVYATLSNGRLLSIASSSIMLEDGAVSTISESIRFTNPLSPSRPATVFVMVQDSKGELHFTLPSKE